MRLKEWKRRRKVIREQNKVTRVYSRRILPFQLPLHALIEGEMPPLAPLMMEYRNYYGEVLYVRAM